MNILYVTSEAVPFCKTGGLADVAGSLPQSLAANGDRVSVILPLYQSVADAWRARLHFERYTYVRLAWRSLYCGLFSYERQGVTWYFVDNEQYFKRPELYGYYDDGERFAFFCRAVTELRDSILFKGTRVRDGVTLRYVITDKYVEVLPGRTLMGHESYPIVISKGSIV